MLLWKHYITFSMKCPKTWSTLAYLQCAKRPARRKIFNVAVSSEQEVIDAIAKVIWASREGKWPHAQVGKKKRQGVGGNLAWGLLCAKSGV
ncbi:hypothetical protein LSM04_005266 [Trypanosoma melophagium]|uniref:uncharacterized protein n=1 Tax=Trypanosoma melophagium TaxID=715481 RepID=UPI00351A9717|nr:hypothetical protein LSM04_005266 [Trypanosoma melophagium]